MKQKCLLVFVGIVVVVQSASIYQHQERSADIPVQVVYDKPEANLASVRNLEEKAEEEKQKEELALGYGVKNLEAKPQLAVVEALETVKNMPEEANKVKIVTPNQPVEINNQPEAIAVSEPVSSYQEQNIDDIYEKIQEIIKNGAKKIQADFEKIPDNSQVTPQKQEILIKVNSTLEEFLDNTKKLIQLRGVSTLKQDAATTSSPIPNPATIFQQILSSFQTFSSNLFSGINPANPQGTQSEGTTASSPFPFNPVEIAQSAFNQLQGSLGSLFGANQPHQQQGAQSDETPAPPQANNPIQLLQQTFNNIFNRPTPVPGGQSDEASSTPNGVIGFVQNAFQNVQNAFQPPTAAPAQHDEVTQATTPGGPLQFFQNAGQNVISALQNNPLFPGTTSTATPQTLGNPGTTPAANPVNPAIVAGQNAVSQLTQVNPQLASQIPNNPFQQQAQQAITTGTNQANQVVAQLTQQGVPVPEQVNTAINTAQSVNEQIGQGDAATTAKPAVVVETPAAPAAASDVAEDVVEDEVKEESEVAPDALVEEEAPVKEEFGIKEDISNEVTENKEEKKEVPAPQIVV